MAMVKGRSVQDLVADDTLSQALQRLIEIIGEAVAQICPETQTRYPSIPWSQAKRMRDRIIHRYFDVNPQIVWDTVIDDLPLLLSQVEELLGQKGTG